MPWAISTSLGQILPIAPGVNGARGRYFLCLDRYGGKSVGHAKDVDWEKNADGAGRRRQRGWKTNAKQNRLERGPFDEIREA